MSIEILPDADALALRAADLFALTSQEGAAARGRFAAAFSGGETPRAFYRMLARQQFSQKIPWRRVQLYWSDERCVPPDDPASNYGMAEDALLQRIPVRPDQVHRVRGELPPEEAARLAEDDLRATVTGSPWPVLDLVLLGMGADGHTASLFPGSAELDESRRLMVPVHRPQMPQPWRVSMTLPVLNAARRVLVLVGAPEKAPMVRRAVEGDRDLPAGRLRPADGVLTWLLTEEAAAELDQPAG